MVETMVSVVVVVASNLCSSLFWYLGNRIARMECKPGARTKP